MRKNFIIKWLLPVLMIIAATGCNKFLDIVPDNVPTIENAFTIRQEAEKYLFTCYSYLPNSADLSANPGFLAGDEFWMVRPYSTNEAPWQIAMGFMTPGNVYLSGWAHYYKALRDCNIFLDNVDKVVDMTSYEKMRWAAEVKFLKAYYHFLLFRMYGPVPVVDRNLPISSSSAAAKVKRAPVDSVVNYVTRLMDEAAKDLPPEIMDRATELGRMTQPIALAVKAKVLVTAASPLFNGNTDYSGVTGKDSPEPLFPQAYDPEKWVKAVDACKTAIASCKAARMQLYKFNELGVQLSDTLMRQMTLRNAACEQWNPEIIWNNPNARTYNLQRIAMPRLDPNRLANEQSLGALAPTMKMAELFYTDKGVPIREDVTWDYNNRYKLRTATKAEGELIFENYQTAGLHFNREPRFYASLAFDGAMWYMQNGMFHIENKLGQWQSRKNIYDFNVTGYYAKKLINWKYVIQEGQGIYIESYAWPEMRLADLYLLYAEALNEVNGPTAEAYEYVNMIRERAGLKTVQEAWSTYSRNPGKYLTKAGFREIIQQERQIELAFEGHRFWDLRRWKKSIEELNKPVTGWDVAQEKAEYYYRPRLLFNQQFQLRDYLWPLHDWDLLNNENLVQNPGW